MKEEGRKSQIHFLMILILTLAILLIGVVTPVVESAAQQPDKDNLPPDSHLRMEQYQLTGLVETQPGSPPSKELTVTDIGPASTSTLTKTIVDTEIWQAQPNTNYANELLIYVGYRNSMSDRMLLQIPLWDLPPGVSINSATLRFAVSGWYDYSGTSRTITAYRMTSIWHEELATWNHAPGIGEAVGSVSVGTPSEITWYSIDLTNLARAWYNGTYTNHGIMLMGPEGGVPAYRIIASGETVYSPQLEVNYTLQPPTLGVTPSSFSFLASDQGSGPLSQTLRILNSGSQPLQWQVSGILGWINLSQISGTISLGSFQSVGVNVDTSGLSYGSHVGQVEISSSTSGVQGSPQSVNVILNYSENLASLYLPVIAKDSTGGSNPPPVAKKALALLIGIADYEYLGPSSNSDSRAGDPESGDLFYTVYDTKETNSVLSAIGPFGGGCGCGAASSSADLSISAYPSDKIMMLTDSQARLANIQAAFEWLDDNEDEDTLVIISYSGHGGRIPDDNGDESDGWDEFIAAYDIYSDGSTYHNIIRDDELDAWLSELESNQIIFLVDSCHSGGIIDVSALGLTNNGISKGLPLLAQPSTQSSPIGALDAVALDIGKPGRVVLAASAADQASWEFGALNHGVFTYYLLMALMDPSADTNGNGRVSAEEAHAYLSPKVDNYVWQHTSPHQHQNTQIFDGVSGNLDITCP